MMSPAKPGLVLIPGLLCDALMWKAQIEALEPEFKCWVADHTRSDTIAGVAADVLRNAPFERFALAGLSMGGYAAFEIVRRAAHRVQRLALLDTSARADTSEQRRKREAFIALAKRGRFVGVTQRLLPLYVHGDRQGDLELVNTLKEMARNIGRDAFVRQEQAIMSRPDSLALLATIACPTLVLCGRQDALTPLARHEEIARGISGATLKIIERCGHLSPLERPAEVTEALRAWLAAG